MNKSFLKIPLETNSLLELEPNSYCSELESIDQYIELILTTCPGEHAFDKNFGCKIWDMDFEKVSSRKKWEDEFSKYIYEAVSLYEKRLNDITVSIEVMEVTKEDEVTKTTAIKKKVVVQVKGYILNTAKYGIFRYKLFLGPLSTE